MFGTMPAYGFFIRHVRDLEMSEVEVRTMKEDLRPAFVLEEVEGADFLHVKAQRAADVATFALKNVQDFTVNLSRPVPDTHLGNVQQKTL